MRNKVPDSKDFPGIGIRTNVFFHIIVEYFHPVFGEVALIMRKRRYAGQNLHLEAPWREIRFNWIEGRQKSLITRCSFK